MKILALVTDAYEGYGGLAQSNRDIFNSLNSKSEIEKLIILPRLGPNRPIVISEKTKQLSSLTNRILFSLQALEICIKEGPFDVIFCGHLYLLPLAVVLSGLFKNKFWLHLHGIEAWPAPSRIMQKLIQKTQLITVVSRFTRRKFLSWANVDPDHVKVLSNTFDEAFKVEASKPDIIRQHNLEGKKVLLAVSRLAMEGCHKGYDRMFKVIKNMRHYRSDFVYVIVGDGNGKTHLESQAKEMGIENHVKFLGQLPKPNLIQLYQTADLFVMHSNGEGFGIVFLEAAACGLRVICGNSDGSGDPLQDGLLGDNVSEESLEETIQKRLQEPWGLKDRSDLSEKVKLAFDQEIFRKKMDNVLKQF